MPDRIPETNICVAVTGDTVFGKLRYGVALASCVFPDFPRLVRYYRWVCRTRAWAISLADNCKIGKNVAIQRGFKFSNIIDLDIGDGCTIKNNVTITGSKFRIGAGSVVLSGTEIDASGGVVVGAGSHIGRDNMIVSHYHDIGRRDQKVIGSSEIFLPVEIGDDVMLYSNVTVVAGCTINDGVVVAIGSVATKVLEPYGIYAGVPARKIGERS